MEDEIMVSISCLVYNHEKYLRQCLDGFIMQKTDFRFEVLVHDDASTDGSADIIREYEQKYPEIIKPIYQTKNKYSRGVRIAWRYQYPRAQGKYIAVCEGDDYWTDCNKLQKQFDALEGNNSCVFCACCVRSTDKNGVLLDEVFPSRQFELFSDTVIPGDKCIRILFSKNRYLFQTSSYFFRAELVQRLINNVPAFFRLSPVGDIPLMQYFASCGDFYYIHTEMSCYRRNSGGNWTKINWSSVKRHIIVNERYIESCKAFNRFTDYRYDETIKEGILYYEFETLVMKRDFKKALQKQYRSILRACPLKQRLYYRLFGTFPVLDRLYMKWKSKKQNQSKCKRNV